jgi:hypothetical protein
MSEEDAPTQPRNINAINFMNVFKDSQASSPYYFKEKNIDSKDANLLHFDRHFNQDLAIDSVYFKTLNAFMSCVEKNAGLELTVPQQEKICAHEYKNLRLRGFDSQLMYHNVNKKFFQNELALFKHESPY